MTNFGWVRDEYTKSYTRTSPSGPRQKIWWDRHSGAFAASTGDKILPDCGSFEAAVNALDNSVSVAR